MSLAACRPCGNQQRVFRWLLAAFWLVLVQVALPAGAQGTSPPIGYIDTAHYDASKELIVVQGWLYEADLPPAATVFSATVGGSRARVLDAQRTERREAAQSLGLAPGSRLGFRLEVAYPRYASAAPQPVAIAATLANGRVLALPASNGDAALHITGRGTPLRHYLIAGLLLPAIALLTWARRRPWRQPRLSAARLWLTAGTLYAALVAGGITGSSLGALVGTSQYPNPLLDASSTVLRLAGSPRSVRSDEWLVLGGSALAQVNHQPPFPVVNRLLGLDGQNMMVIGMTGVPVAHVSTLARPATWGYFFLPLRQALAWHWYFPFFACLLALWSLLQTLAGDRPVRNLGLTLLFCSAPYAAGWSNWPLYVTAWACGALALALRMLHQPASAVRVALQGVAQGWLLACFALTLYPPWQIPLATLCLLLFAVRAVPVWRSQQGRWAAMPGFGCAALVCAMLLFAWWAGAQDAIAAMEATVYPGQRAALHGGDMPAAALLRGYSNVDTLAHLRYSLLNASEFASYFFLFLPLGWLALRQVRTAEPGLAAALLAFTCFALFFAVAGVPPLLAQALLWHRVPGPRLDLVLGLTSVLLLALLPPTGTPASQRVYAGPRMAAGLAIAWALTVATALHAIPADFYPHLSVTLLLTLSACATAMAYLWMRGHLGVAITLQLLVNLVAIATFHPIGRAPAHVVASMETLQHALDTATGAPVRVLALDRSSASSMGLAATGIPVVGGAFYYPQPTLWDAAHLPPPSWSTVNRYQHLAFVTGAPGGVEPYTITAPAPDEVLVTVDPGRFDFSRTGAQRVVAGLEAADLGHNPSLRLLGRSGGWTWFAVRAVPGASDF